MVVLESAVFNGTSFGASSARTADAMLTAPTAARPNVHLLNFICVPPVIVYSLFVCLFLLVISGAKPVRPWLAPEGAIEVKTKENPCKWQILFLGRIQHVKL